MGSAVPGSDVVISVVLGCDGGILASRIQAEGARQFQTGRKEAGRLKTWMEGARWSQAVTKEIGCRLDEGNSAAQSWDGEILAIPGWEGRRKVGSLYSAETEGVR